MAAVDPDAASWLVENRDGAHDVLEALDDPKDGGPRVDKTDSSNTAPCLFQHEYDGLIVRFRAGEPQTLSVRRASGEPPWDRSSRVSLEVDIVGMIFATVAPATAIWVYGASMPTIESKARMSSMTKSMTGSSTENPDSCDCVPSSAVRRNATVRNPARLPPTMSCS